MSNPDETVDCPRHGEGIPTWTCRHLAQGIACGYHGNRRTPEDPWPDAWCDACRQILEQEKGWNERSESFAGVSQLCHRCYEEARSLNAVVPFETDEGAAQLTEIQSSALIQKARNYAKMVQEDVEERYRLSASKDVELDREGCRITFSMVDGGLVAEAQLMGSLSSETSSWLWSWADDSVPEPLRRLASQRRLFGEVRGMQRLTEGSWEAGLGQAWEMVALGAYLTDADAVYLAQLDRVQQAFLVLTDLRGIDTLTA